MSQTQPRGIQAVSATYTTVHGRILNPLSEDRDGTHNLMVPNQICFCCATMGTLEKKNFFILYVSWGAILSFFPKGYHYFKFVLNNLFFKLFWKITLHFLSVIILSLEKVGVIFNLSFSICWMGPKHNFLRHLQLTYLKTYAKKEEWGWRSDWLVDKSVKCS